LAGAGIYPFDNNRAGVDPQDLEQEDEDHESAFEFALPEPLMLHLAAECVDCYDKSAALDCESAIKWSRNGFTM
jgi:hypothetical protein